MRRTQRAGRGLAPSTRSSGARRAYAECGDLASPVSLRLSCRSSTGSRTPVRWSRPRGSGISPPARGARGSGLLGACVHYSSAPAEETSPSFRAHPSKGCLRDVLAILSKVDGSPERSGGSRTNGATPARRGVGLGLLTRLGAGMTHPSPLPSLPCRAWRRGRGRRPEEK